MDITDGFNTLDHLYYEYVVLVYYEVCIFLFAIEQLFDQEFVNNIYNLYTDDVAKLRYLICKLYRLDCNDSLNKNNNI